jgi:hypothetical protein
MKLRKGDHIRLEPDADISLTYTDDPKEYELVRGYQGRGKMAVWVVDCLMGDDVVNVSTLYDVGDVAVGGLCANVPVTDVLEVLSRGRER